MKKISVIIPCYNAVKYLSTCTDSLEKQTIGMENLELIFVNDASSDQTLERLYEFQHKYPESVVVIDSKENKRQGGARNLGLARAAADYVAFMDDDDYLEPQMLEKLYEKAEENQADLVVCYAKRHALEEKTTVQMGRTGREDSIYEIDSDAKRLPFLKKNINTAIWNKLYKKSVLIENAITFPENIIYDDIYFSGIVKLCVAKAYILEEYLYHHVVYQEAASMDGQDWKKKAGYLEAHELLAEAYRKLGALERFGNYYLSDFLLSYFTCIQTFYSNFYRIPLEQLRRAQHLIRGYFPEYKKNEIYQTYMKSGQRGTLYQTCCMLLDADLDNKSIHNGMRVNDILIGDPSQREDFFTELQILIDLLESMTSAMLTNLMSVYNRMLPELSDMLTYCMPLIISSYSRPELKEVAGDALYWSDQLGRIIDTLEEQDIFKIADVLYNETRENLIQYRRMIMDMEITL